MTTCKVLLAQDYHYYYEELVACLCTSQRLSFVDLSDIPWNILSTDSGTHTRR